MVERLNHAWRLGATGFCFLTFGIGGLLMRALVFPAVSLAAGRLRLVYWTGMTSAALMAVDVIFGDLIARFL